MKWLTILILSIVVLVYLLVGAAIFMALEKNNETSVVSTQSATFQQFLTDNPCVTQDELTAFGQAVIAAYDAGVIATSTTSSASNWDYGPSVFFSLTVVTSIGYGHVSPVTAGGQVFFVFYAIFGIPMMAVLLGALGEKLMYPVKKLEEKTCTRKYASKEKFVKRFLIGIAGFVLFSFIPAAIFTAVEGWSYREAWYFTIVTLTTVGFGDYVTGQNDSEYRALYKIIVCFWIVIGLSWLSLMLNLVGDAIKSTSVKVDKSGSKKGKDDETGDGESTKKDELEMTTEQ